MSQPRFWLIVSLIGLVAASRLVEHPWNLAPMGALALFAGAHLRDWRWAFGVPLVALIVGDIALGAMHNDFSFWTFHALMPANYLCYALSVGLGIGVHALWTRIDASRDKGQTTAPERWGLKSLTLGGATLAGSIVFFIVTNFAVWLLFPTYPHTMEGLALCYEKAIPFFRNTFLSDAFYVALMFGGYAALGPIFDRSAETSIEMNRW